MINKLIVDGQNITLNESTQFPFTYTFSKAGVHNVRVGLDMTDEVCAYAFKDCSDLTKVTFPSKIENIKRYAFENCTSLKSIDLPDTIKYVGPGTFDGCIALSEINFAHTTPPQFYSELTAGTKCFVPDGHKFVLAEGELKKDGKVALVGFGTMLVTKRDARQGRNPRTGKDIKIPAKKVVKFKPALNILK